MKKKFVKRDEQKTARRVRAPRGFHFKIKIFRDKKYPNDDYAIVSLRESKNPDIEIGHIGLYRQFYPKRRRDYWETHSELDYSFHGRGLGALMYAKAIQWCLDNGYKVRSSGSSSEMAKRVWNGKKIRQFFSIQKRVTKWGSETWIAYR